MTDSQSTSTNAVPDNAQGGTAPATVGALLRQSREGAGLNIADVARALRISQKYLDALEDGRHADLPGTAYAIGFVRSYAEHLHLDSDEIVRRYKDEAAGIGNKNDLVFPKPIVDGGVPGGAVLGLGVMIAAVAYGVWYWNSTNTEVETARVEVVPEHMAVQEQAAPKTVVDTPVEPTATVEKPVETVAPSIAEAAVEVPVVEAPVVAPPVVEAPIDEVVARAVSPVEPAVPTENGNEPTAQEAEAVAELTAPTVEPMVESVAAPSAAPIVEPITEPSAAPIAESVTEPAVAMVADQIVDEPANETPGVADQPVPDTTVASVTPAAPADDGPSRITVRAKSNSWIQVRDEIADRLLFTRLLREGQEYQVPNRDGLRLMTGNAGALELLVDGTAVPAIGGVGEVRRNVELDVDKLQNGSAVTE